MKTTLILCTLATSALAGTPVTERVTPEAVTKLQQENPMLGLQQPAAGEAKVTTPEHQSILKDSTILHDGENWTLVPKGAVVFLPESLKSRVDAKPVGKLLTFSDFITVNQSWITTNEVNFDQAVGNEALPAETVVSLAKQEKLVIAVHLNGPISVRIAGESKTIAQR